MTIVDMPAPSPFLDLHAHYPMHLLDERRALKSATKPIAVKSGFLRAPLNFMQRLIMLLANNLFNFPAMGRPAVTIEKLRDGKVTAVLSVLYAPFDEMDFSKSYGSPPSDSYFQDLLDQISAVESDIENNYRQAATVAHNLAELDQAVLEDKVALIHAVEGGFHVGDRDEIVKNVGILAKHGIAYITVAHLFFRQLATDAPAIPFLSDKVYDFIFPQKPGLGLTPLGETLIQAMVENGILIDITHMSEKSIDDTFGLLSHAFPHQTIPVLATHTACRFDGLKFKFNMNDANIQRIAESGGVVGLTSCEHFMSEGMAEPATFEDSMQILIQHIDHIHSVTGSYDHISIGLDLDGFIKPSLPGFETSASCGAIEESLEKACGRDVAQKICYSNAMRVLRQAWQKPIQPLNKAGAQR